MVSNILFTLVVIVVVVTTILELYRNNKNGIKLTASEILRRHIVFYCLQFMILSVLGGSISIILLIMNFSVIKIFSLGVCIIVFFISKILYVKNKIYE